MTIKYFIAIKKVAYDEEGKAVASGLGMRSISTHKLDLNQKREMHSILPEIYTEAISKFNEEMEKVNEQK